MKAQRKDKMYLHT